MDLEKAILDALALAGHEGKKLEVALLKVEASLDDGTRLLLKVPLVPKVGKIPKAPKVPRIPLKV